MSREEAFEELALRVLYEVVFDIIPIGSLSDTSWMFASNQRDIGHNRRIELLTSRIIKLSSISEEDGCLKYPWLKIPGSIKNKYSHI